MHKGMVKSGGLSDVFTVFSESTSFKINLNDAPYELLLSIPGMTSEVALEIIEERREEEFENISDARLKELPNYTQIAGYLTVDPTNFYRVEARGRIADGAMARAITAVIKFTTQEGKKFEILYWQEGV
jgi:type II secretory pathway component PulK